MTKSISLLFTIGLIGLNAVTLMGCSEGPLPLCPASKIKAIGGCDKYGACGVILEDGTETFGIGPVVGGHVLQYGCRRVTQ